MSASKIISLAAMATVALAHEAHGEEGHTCGTHIEDWEVAEATRIADNVVKQVCSEPALSHVRVCLPYEERIKRPVEVPVWYHIAHNGPTGQLTAQQVQAQFDQTQLDFSGEEDPRIPGAARMDITFRLAGTTYSNNAAWFNDLDANEVAMKNAVAVDNRFNFNQYFGNLRGGLLGFCYFPNSFAESSVMHGCVNLYSSIPGGSSTNYNEGKTTTHETGHGIGLFHTFQGGCNGQGDQVGDTCNQASPTSGCPTSRNSCNNGCMDPINNYMDYSFDRCMTQFTRGQNDRANAQLFAFRPSLYLAEYEEDLELINQVMPSVFDDAKAFARSSEDRYMAMRKAKGFNDPEPRRFD